MITEGVGNNAGRGVTVGSCPAGDGMVSGVGVTGSFSAISVGAEVTATVLVGRTAEVAEVPPAVSAAVGGEGETAVGE